MLLFKEQPLIKFILILLVNIYISKAFGTTYKITTLKCHNVNYSLILNQEHKKIAKLNVPKYFSVVVNTDENSMTFIRPAKDNSRFGQERIQGYNYFEKTKGQFRITFNSYISGENIYVLKVFTFFKKSRLFFMDIKLPGQGEQITVTGSCNVRVIQNKKEKTLIKKAEKKENDSKKKELDEIRKKEQQEKSRKAEIERKRKEDEKRIKETERKKKKEISKLYKVGSGTGFAVSKSGHVITNNHVIKGCQKVKVHTAGKKYISQVLSRDEKNDLALLRGNFKPKFVFPISNKTSELMEEVYVAGFPFGYRLSTRIKVTKGIISSLAGLGDDFTRVQIDAAMQPGNSGGPIYNNLGNVVGVAVAKLDYKYSMKKLNTIPELTNFGIKSSMLQSFLSASGVKTRKSVKKRTPMLGQAIQDGTYYVSCLMTMAQYNSFKSKKVLFKEEQVSAESEIN